MQKKTIAEIKHILESTSVSEVVLTTFRNDSRKGVKRLVEQYERKQKREKKLREQFLLKQSFDFSLAHNGEHIAGVDEAGRGPLAGPVVAAAVILPRDFFLLELNDSKQLSEQKRSQLFEVITSEAISYSYAIVSNEEIDRLNILGATKKAMQEALYHLDVEPDIALIDAVELNELRFPQRSIIEGDSKSLAIGAASIVAKVIRDRLMDKLHEEYPMYDFKQNKGYGTKSHLDALKTYGITKYHRKSFTPVQAFAHK